MTIVLQNQFWGLKVGEDQFEVGLTFQKLPAMLVIPFAALTAFVDPSVQFGLQFRNSSAAKKVPAPPRETAKEPSKPLAPRDASKDASVESLPARKPAKDAKDAPPSAEQPAEKLPSDPQVVSFDKFRKK
jgi:hypothetical protein